MSRTSEVAAHIDPSSSGIAAIGMVSDNSRDADPGSSLLLLEDDDALRQMLDWELAELGYCVFAVGSCGEAREALAARRFDFALFDIELPDGNGAELAGELIEMTSAPQIVLCSGRSGTTVSERIVPGVLAFIAKPVSIQRLDALFRGRAYPGTPP